MLRAWLREIVAGVATVCAAISLAGCGDSAPDLPAVRIGQATIGRAEASLWTGAIARGARPGKTLGLQLSDGESPRQAALRFLILAKWLTDAAAADGVAISRRAVEAALHEQLEIDGDELTLSLRASGLTIADARLEIEAELAAQALARVIAGRAADVTAEEVVTFYQHNRARFRLGEQRETELIKMLPSRAAALALSRRIGVGAGFARRTTNHELLLATYPPTDHEHAVALRAIFAARPNVVSSPITINEHWALFVVRKVFPARLLPFRQAKAAVRTALIAHRRSELIARYLDELRSRWTTQTSCRPGYVVPGCRQDARPLPLAPILFSDG